MELTLRLPNETVIGRGEAQGVHREADAFRLPLGAATVAENVALSRKALTSVGGRVRHAVPSVTGTARGLGAYVDGGATRLILGVGSTLLASDTNQLFVTPTTITSSLASASVRMAQFNRGDEAWLYFVDGTNPVRRWKPGSTVVELTNLQHPASLPSIASTVTLGSLVAYQNDSAYGYYVDASGAGTNVPGYTQPMPVKVGATHTNVLTYVVRNGGYPSYEGGLNYAMLEIVPTDNTGAALTGQTRVVRRLDTATDLSTTDSLTLRMGASVAGVYSETQRLGLAVLGTDLAVDAGWVWVPFPAEYTDLGGGYREYTFDLTGIAEASRNAVVYIAYDILFTSLAVAARYAYLSPNAYHHEINYAVSIFLISLTTDVGATFFQDDDYEFTHAYVWGRGTVNEEIGPIARGDDPLHAYTSITVDADTVEGLRATVVTDVATGTAYDGLAIYARGGTSDEWRQIGSTLSVTPGQTYTLDWNGEYGIDAAILVPYVEAPPAGCTHLLAHQGRLFYLKGRKLYISNASDGDKVPQSALFEVSDISGFYAEASQTSDCLALGELGESLLVWSKSGASVLTGDDASSFVLRPLESALGCDAPGSVVGLGGNLLLWLSPDGTVQTWDGQTFATVSQAIDDLLTAHSVANRQAATAVVLPKDLQYRLTIPGATALTGTTYTYDLRTGEWTTRPNQPSGPHLYSRDAAAPGVYALDTAGTALFRLDSGTTVVDAANAATALPMRWRSGLLGEIGQYLCPTHIVLRASARTTLSSVTVTLYGPDDVALATKALTFAQMSNREAVASWHLPLLMDTETFSVEIAASASSAVDFTNCVIVVRPMGRKVR